MQHNLEQREDAYEKETEGNLKNIKRRRLS
jgi:hypothetical protein